MAKTTNAKIAGAKDTSPSFGKDHGIGKMAFSFEPASGKSSGARTTMREKIKMRPPPSGKQGTGHGAGKKPTSLTQFNKGLIVRGKKQLMG